MSLGKYKNKSEIYSDTFDVEWEKVADCWYGEDYYDGWDYDPYDYCTDSCCIVEYSVRQRFYRTYVHKSFGWTRIDEQLVGEFIDMDTIYQMGTIYYRERMLKRLLGEEVTHSETKVTLRDYFPKNKEIKNL